MYCGAKTSYWSQLSVVSEDHDAVDIPPNSKFSNWQQPWNHDRLLLMPRLISPKINAVVTDDTFSQTVKTGLYLKNDQTVIVQFQSTVTIV